MIKSQNVRFGEIVHMDIVPDAGSVLGGIVGAEDAQDGSVRTSGGEGKRDEVRLGIVKFTNLSAFIGTRSVEIAQRGETQTVSTIVRFQSIFEEEFRDAVGIDRPAHGIFCHGNFVGSPVDRTG
jgi:hypothetical protein